MLFWFLIQKYFHLHTVCSKHRDPYSQSSGHPRRLKNHTYDQNKFENLHAGQVFHCFLMSSLHSDHFWPLHPFQLSENKDRFAANHYFGPPSWIGCGTLHCRLNLYFVIRQCSVVQLELKKPWRNHISSFDWICHLVM